MKKEELAKFILVPWPMSQKIYDIEGYDDYCMPSFDASYDLLVEESWYDEHQSEIEGDTEKESAYAEEFVEAFGTKVQCALMCDAEIYDEAKAMYISDRIAGVTSCPEEFITRYGDFRTFNKEQ